MSQKNTITVFSVGNGDSIFIDALDKKILTDINFRKAAEDEDDDEAPDISEDIRNACSDGHLDIFVLTHPDADHLRGFEELFHTGSPSDWSYDDNADDKLLADEIWCSSYATHPNYKNDISKPLLHEIKRRNALRGTAGGNETGNRLKVCESGDEVEVNANILATVLAPTANEVDIGTDKINDNWPSSNPTSVVINWNIQIEGKGNRMLSGGDAPVEIWERIYDEKYENEQGDLAWHILIAPHHCSRYALGRKNEETDGFDWSEKAEQALSIQLGEGYIVSSSKEIKRNDDDPPSWSAKQRYQKILAHDGEVTGEVKDRFLCTGGDTQEDGPHHIIIELSSSGPVREFKGTKSAAVISSVGGGGSYGEDGY